jgi:hypothetical protein
MAERKAKAKPEQRTPAPTPTEKTPQPDLPETWIAIAAYYIWKNEGEPEGNDVNYWQRAKAELSQLWMEGRLPIERSNENT